MRRCFTKQSQSAVVHGRKKESLNAV